MERAGGIVEIEFTPSAMTNLPLYNNAMYVDDKSIELGKNVYTFQV
jgi:hypothetical protein